MEGKALIFKSKANIDAWPLVLDTQDADEIVRIVKAVAPSFGGINLEDIAAPKCFDIEKRLIEELDMPVMHDDQHGTAIVVLAALLNAAKVVKKDFGSLKIVISGAGAAGIATAKLLRAGGAKDIVLLDRAGTIFSGRGELNASKAEIAKLTNPRKVKGDLAEAMRGADVFIGLSGKGIMHAEHVRAMAPKGIVFAMANPDPEILPDEAGNAGAAVVATGRSDFPNQINNSLVFPGVFRGALDKGVRRITEASKLRAARALAALIKKPTAEKILPDMLDPRVVGAVAKAIR
jgi:malate dehydrogenase (oxaloacetate-decarboxylating)